MISTSIARGVASVVLLATRAGASFGQDRTAGCAEQDKETGMISFKGAQFPQEVILHTSFIYLRYGASYRDLEEI